MGFRFRKSINLGGGLRVNLSKSGVGYSWGVKGYRVTKTAKGTTRRTASIPGTGISYVTESGNKPKNLNQQNNSNPNAKFNSVNDNYYDTKNIENQNASNLVSYELEEMIKAARKSIILDCIAIWGMIITGILSLGNPYSLLLFLLFLVMDIIVRKCGVITIEYAIDENQEEFVKDRIAPIVKVSKSNKIWRIMQTNKVKNKKYTAGASNVIKRVKCKSSNKVPFPFKCDIDVVCFKSGKENLVFLPDKLLVIQGSRIGALCYEDITTNIETTRFIEEEAVPKDAKIVDHTWKYVNKSGGPDKRFKDNKKLPVCLYGKISLTSNQGLNSIIMFSNINLE